MILVVTIAGSPQGIVAKEAGGHGSLICSSLLSPKKWARSVGNSGVSPRSSMRLKWTCSLQGLGVNTLWLILVVKWWHPAAYVEVLSGCILLTPLLLDSCHWGCR